MSKVATRFNAIVATDLTPHATFFPLISSHSTVLKEGDAKRKNDTEHMICDAISS